MPITSTLRKLPKPLVILAALAGLFVLANLVAFWWMSGSLARRLERIHAAGDPVSREDLIAELRGKPSAAPNAAITIQEACDIAATIEPSLTQIVPRLTEPGFRLTPAELEQLAGLEADCEKLHAKVAQAMAEPRYASLVQILPDMINTSLPQVQRLRAIPRSLCIRARYQIQTGKCDDAFETCLNLLAVTKHFDQEPFLVSHLVSNACRGMALESMKNVLQGAILNASQRQRLDAEMALHDTWEPYRRAVKIDRVLGINALGSQFRYVPPIRDNSIQIYLDVADHELSLIGKSMAACGKVPAPPAPTGPTRVLGFNYASQVMPAYEAARHSTARTIAKVRCLRILNALQAADDEQGRKITSLNQLVLPQSALVDPFSGSELKFRRDAKGWVVYSVGGNLRDDQGDLHNPDRNAGDVGVGPEVP